MSLLSWLPGAQGFRSTATPKDSDIVVPLRFFDDTPPLRASILAWTFRFDDVLDHVKLRDALAGLLKIPSWRYLGARLRLNSRGKLEMHVPKEHTRSRPAFKFSHVRHQTNIDDDPLSQRLPKSTATPSIHAGAPEFRAFAARANAPAVMEDFLNSDEPQLSMHVVTFDDATLVSLSFPHTLTDVMGVADLMSALSLMLAGRDGQIPSLRAPEDDPLENVGTASDASANEKYDLADYKFGAINGLRFAFNYLWDKFWYPEMETRIAFLPAEFMQKLRREAEADLAKDSTTEKVPFISDGDILSAWATSMIQAFDPTPRPAIIMNVLNVRGRLPGVLDTGDVHMQNLVFNSNALLTAEESKAGKLGVIASKVRQSLAKQTTEPQIRAIIKDSRAALAATGYAPLYGDPTARLIIVSNWDKSKMFDAVDFSPAVVDNPYKKRSAGEKPGRLVYHHAQSLKDVMEARHFFNIIGKNRDSGYWISGILMPQTWRKIEESLGVAQKLDV